jgi:hypothetical protein
MFFNYIARMQSTIIAKINLFHRWYTGISAYHPQSFLVFIALLKYDFILVEVPRMISKFCNFGRSYTNAASCVCAPQML